MVGKIMVSKIQAILLIAVLSPFIPSHSASAQAPDFLFETSHGDSTSAGYTPFALSSSWGDTFDVSSGSRTMGGSLSGSATANTVTASSEVNESGTTAGLGGSGVYALGSQIKIWSRGLATVKLNATSSGSASVSNTSTSSGPWGASYRGIPFISGGSIISASIPYNTPGSDSSTAISPPQLTSLQGTITCSGGATFKSFPEYPGLTYRLAWSGDLRTSVTTAERLAGNLHADGTTTIIAERGSSAPIASFSGPVVSGAPQLNLVRGVSNTFTNTSIDPDGGPTYQSADICSRGWTITKPGGTPVAGTGNTISITPANPGPYTVALAVTDNEGDSNSTSAVEYIVGGEKTCTPGSRTIRPRGCSDEKTSVEVDPYCGRASATSHDPTATRGYPLRNEIRVISQLSSLPVTHPMGNAFFTYGMQVVALTNTGGGTPADPRRFLVDGYGNEYDYGLASSGASPKTAGVFPSLTVDANGYTLVDAGAPTAIYESGNFSYRFSSTGALVSITDPNSNVQTVSYSSGRPTVVTDGPTARTVTFEYDGNNRINNVIENGGFASRTIGYDANDRVTSITTKDSSNVTVRDLNFTYDNQNRLASITRDNDPATTATLSYVYGGAGRSLANIAYPSGSTNFDYYAVPAAGTVNYRTTSTNAKSGVSIYDYDAAGNLVAVLEPTYNFAAGTPNYAFVNHAYTYDANRNILSHSVGNTSETYTYNARGKVTRVIDAAGRYTDYTYAANGLDLIKIQDNEAVIAQFQYGNAALPHAVSAFLDPAGSVWGFARNTFGQVTAITPPAGAPTKVWNFTYEESNRSSRYGLLRTITNSAGDTVTVNAYSPLGDPTSITTSPSAGVTRTVQMAYDATQRETVYTHGDGKTIQTAYTGANATSVVDEAGTLNQYTYCPECGKLPGASGPLSWSLSWLLDNDTDVTKFTDALGHETNYEYGRARELRRITYPEGANSAVTYLYDNVGRLRNLTNVAGANINYTYDASSNLASDRYYTYTYDNAGRLLTATGASSTVTYTYGANRLVATVTYAFSGTGAPANQTLQYSYYPDQTLSGLKWFNGVTTGLPVIQWVFGYDRAGRLVAVRNDYGETTYYTYDGESKLLAQSNQNGTSRLYTYNDQRGWPASLAHKLGSTDLAKYTLTYDAAANTVGNLTNVAETGSWVGAASNSAYSYDALYRLTAETRSGGSNPFANTFGYDLAGNPTTVNGSNIATYNLGNQLATYQGKTANHYLDGTLREILNSPITFKSALWNEDSKMVQFKRTNNSTVDYRYLYDGKRYYSKDSVAGSPDKFYIFAGDLLIGEIENGVPTVAYTWGADGLISERLLTVGIGGIDNLIDQQSSTTAVGLPGDEDGNDPILPVLDRCTPNSCAADIGTTLWYHFGPQGETRYMTDKNATLTDSYLYNSYGNPVSFTANYYNQFRYGAKYGYYTEVSTQFVLATQRWYAPQLMRWVSKDPSGYDGGVNLYEYAKSAPTKYVDVTGKNPVVIVIGFCEAAPSLCVAAGAATVALVGPAVEGVRNAVLQCARAISSTKPKSVDECFADRIEKLENECRKKSRSDREKCEQEAQTEFIECARTGQVPLRRP